MRMLAIVAIVACCLGNAGTATGTTLREALLQAYLGNTDLAAQRAALAAVETQVAQARAGYLPTITGSLQQQSTNGTSDSAFTFPNTPGREPQRLRAVDRVPGRQHHHGEPDPQAESLQWRRHDGRHGPRKEQRPCGSGPAQLRRAVRPSEGRRRLYRHLARSCGARRDDREPEGPGRSVRRRAAALRAGQGGKDGRRPGRGACGRCHGGCRRRASDACGFGGGLREDGGRPPGQLAMPDTGGKVSRGASTRPTPRWRQIRTRSGPASMWPRPGPRSTPPSPTSAEPRPPGPAQLPERSQSDDEQYATPRSA